MAPSYIYEGPGTRLVIGGQTMVQGQPTELSGAAVEAAERHPNVTAAASAPPTPSAPAWGTTVKDALAYVGDDRERAAEVLSAEQERGEQARTSLVAALEQLLNTGDQNAG